MALNDPAREAAEHLYQQLARLAWIDNDNTDRIHVTLSLPDGTLIGSTDLAATTIGELGDTAQHNADDYQQAIGEQVAYFEETLIDPQLAQDVEDCLSPYLDGQLHPDALDEIEEHFYSLDLMDLLNVARSAPDEASGIRAFDYLVTGEIDEDGAL